MWFSYQYNGHWLNLALGKTKAADKSVSQTLLNAFTSTPDPIV